jgi:hypothetical protein
MILLGMRSAEFFPSARLIETEQLAFFPFQILLRSFPGAKKRGFSSGRIADRMFCAGELLPRALSWHAIDRLRDGQPGRLGAWNHRGYKTKDARVLRAVFESSATLIRADGKDILSVKMHLNSEGLTERDAEVVTPKIGGEDLSL